MTTAQMLVGGTGAQELYTPAPIMGYVREMLGTIDLDPASCEMANTIVQASHYYSKEDDGLVGKVWYGKIFLNPPYTKGLVDRFVHTLIVSYEAGFVEEAILLVRPASDTAW